MKVIVNSNIDIQLKTFDVFLQYDIQKSKLWDETTEIKQVYSLKKHIHKRKM